MTELSLQKAYALDDNTPMELTSVATPTEWISGYTLNEERFSIKTAGSSSITGIRIDANASDLKLALWSATDSNGSHAQVEAVISGVGSSIIGLYKKLFYGLAISEETNPASGQKILVRFIV